ncbi:MAG TPA: Trm112 family protein [Planctomycetota bacterium]|nr:Trm112 family protein [Planctomycetota bacterium]
MAQPSQSKRGIDPELLSILACPETHQGLREASAEELAKLNAAIAAGKVKNTAGKPVGQAFEAALMREDAKRIYPIRDGIPVLFIDEGVPL